MVDYAIDELRRQTASLAADLPALLSEAFAGALRVFGSRPDVLRLFVIGSGDSYNAALTCRDAFAVGDRVELTVQTPLDYLGGTRGPARRDASRTVLIGVSASGGNPWLVEALNQAREQGVITVALTCNADSPVAAAAAQSISLRLSLGAPCPGIRSYQASVIGLLTIAKALTAGSAESHHYFAPLDRVDDIRVAIEGAVVSGNTAAPALATALVDQRPIVVLGCGRTLGTARHVAAKVTETSALPAFGVDTDDWWHVHRFGHDPALPVLIVDEAANHGGRRELIQRIQGRRRVIAVSRDSVALPSVVRPLTDHVIGGLLAASLAQRRGQLPFGNP